MLVLDSGRYRLDVDQLLALGRGQTVARIQYHRSDEQQNCHKFEPSFGSHDMARDMGWRGIVKPLSRLRFKVSKLRKLR